MNDSCSRSDTGSGNHDVSCRASRISRGTPGDCGSRISTENTNAREFVSIDISGDSANASLVVTITFMIQQVETISFLTVDQSTTKAAYLHNSMPILLLLPLNIFLSDTLWCTRKTMNTSCEQYYSRSYVCYFRYVILINAEEIEKQIQIKRNIEIATL